MTDKQLAQQQAQATRLATKFLQHQGDKPLLLKADGYMLQVEDLDKIVWDNQTAERASDQPIRKRHVLAYYAAISPRLLPHLIDRPLGYRQFPDGSHSQSEVKRYQEAPAPEYVTSVEMYSDLANRNMPFLLCQNTATLLWLVNQDALEFYPWYSRINPEQTKLPTIFINSAGTLEMSVANYPDYLVFDLDSVIPLGQTASRISTVDRFKINQEAALYLHQFLQKYGLQSQVKTSGRHGLHVYVPLARQYTYEQTRASARTIGQHLTDANPHLFNMGWQLDNHPRVSIDFHQNALSKAFAAPHSLRATHLATISQPITWKTLETLTDPSQFNLFTLLSQVKDSQFALDSDNNPWPNLDQSGQEIPADLLK